MRTKRENKVVPNGRVTINQIKVCSNGQVVIIKRKSTKAPVGRGVNQLIISGAIKSLSDEAKMISSTLSSLGAFEAKMIKKDSVKIAEDFRKVGKDLHGAISRISEAN